MYKKFVRILLLLLLLIGLAALCVQIFYVKKVNAATATYVYELPYAKGASYKVVQGYGGLFSHNGIAALDFAMPVGTPIYAARGGVLYSYKDVENEGGPYKKYTNKANYIIIKHDDGTYGCYWHLQQNGVVLKKGSVTTGQLIGYSGATGFVWNAHLHFSVKRRLSYNDDAYLKTKFYTKEGIQFLVSGSSYVKPYTTLYLCIGFKYFMPLLV